MHYAFSRHAISLCPAIVTVYKYVCGENEKTMCAVKAAATSTNIIILPTALAYIHIHLYIHGTYIYMTVLCDKVWVGRPRHDGVQRSALQKVRTLHIARMQSSAKLHTPCSRECVMQCGCMGRMPRLPNSLMCTWRIWRLVGKQTYTQRQCDDAACRPCKSEVQSTLRTLGVRIRALSPYTHSLLHTISSVIGPSHQHGSDADAAYMLARNPNLECALGVHGCDQLLRCSQFHCLYMQNLCIAHRHTI